MPPSGWRETHNDHHAHTAKLIGSHIGCYAMLTPRMSQALTPRQRWLYRATRLPLNVLFALRTLFLIGNIGYHQVHHLNAAIPFYRLPEAMEAVPELQHPGRTSLKSDEIAACFRLKLWEPEVDHLVGYPAQNLRP